MVAGSNPDIWCTEEEENILFMIMLGYMCSIWLDVRRILHSCLSAIFSVSSRTM